MLKRVVRYMIIVVRSDMDQPQPIISDYWDGMVETLYVTEYTSVLQVFCTLGRGYFGA